MNPNITNLHQLAHPTHGLKISDQERHTLTQAADEIQRLETLITTLTEEKTFWEKEARNV